MKGREREREEAAVYYTRGRERKIKNVAFKR
jgi:hypothetical protein